MAPRRPERLTPLELEIMKVLWTAGPGGVQSVRDALAPRRKLAYTTVQTMLNVLLRKAVEWDLIDRMPCTIRLLPISKPSAQFHDF